MKFPLPKNIFPPLELSENQEFSYEQLANALIKATLTEYDQFVMHDRKRVDSKRWKTVRTRDGVTIYRERVVDGYEMQKATPESANEDPKPRLHRAHTTVPSSGGETNYQHQLFQQMQDLHSVAETTYQVARANTEAAFKERDSGRMSKASPDGTTGNLRGVRTFSQPFAFNVVGLRSTRAMTVGIDK
ncbi:hypothetical protein AM588_10010281 [Phytophthora nicotianae]|uniref:Uncharacterized protein n=1 Tax=Phytophthora nicotianae TaxID=4792 RepID=A0A0W8DQZ2_PHYNI|nr:hypothetical protein AM588_10010281 [Phytophthora nicotianae]